MKHVLRPVLASLALMVVASAALAAPAKFSIDKTHSEVGFDVRHFFTKVHGRFSDFQGVILFDEKDPAGISVEANAVATSISTDNEKRDGHLRSADFFDVEKYPSVSFKSTKVTPAGKNKYKIAGDFTMRGVTKPVVFDAEFLGSGNVGRGTKAGFSATTTVNRKDFGIVWNKALDNGGVMLGEEVTIALSIEADLVTEGAENAK